MRELHCFIRPSSLVAVLFLPLLAAPVSAQRADGPVIRSAGSVFAVPEPDFETPVDTDYRVVWDVRVGADSPDEVNQGLNTVARFLNMHARAGVPLERMDLAVVVHGTAGKDLLEDGPYRDAYGVDNPNRALLRELDAAGVRIIICGQTAVARGLPWDDLVPEAEVALSAMTAHAVLQGQGYTLNPF